MSENLKDASQKAGKKRKAAAESCQRVSVSVAAAEIGCHPQYLRQKMKAKKWDLGRVEPPSKKNGQYTYLIFRAKLDKFLGIEAACQEEHKTGLRQTSI